MVRLVTVCSMICFLEIKRYQTFIIQKGAPYVVFVFRSLLHWCFYVLTVYSDSKLVPVWLSVWFLPLEEVLCVVIQAPAIRYICVSFALAIWFFDISKNRFKFPVRGCQLIESPDMRLFVGYIICPTSLWYRVLHTPVGAAIEWAIVRRFSDRLASRKWLIESETKF